MTIRMRTMRPARSDEARHSERGSALIIATMVSVILSLLGISYLMMAQTENVIAENERNAALALYVAEAGTRLAINWFNDPSSTGYLVPTTGQVDRTLRVFDHDNDTTTARVQAAASDASKPIYKDAAFTTSTVFDRPYRSALADTLLGVETGADAGFPTAGPDLVVGSGHLTTINDALFPNFPTPFLRARITRIEVYAPPIVIIGGAPTRMGVATVRVTGGVFIYPNTANERQIATRVVKAVINEIPVPGPVGPLQSCANLSYSGSFEIHWGAGSSQAGADLPLASLNTKLHTGVPYNLNDPFTYYQDATPHNLALWAADPAINGNSIEDPWFKYIAGGPITGAPNSNPQPWPLAWPGTTDQDHSNIFQNTVVSCPTFDYDMWKSIAQSGDKNHYYYTWSSGTNFLLDGTGSPVSFVDATGGRTGVFFFDTRYGNKWYGDWNDPAGTNPAMGQTNLTPAISISSSDGWLGLQGFAYLNASMFQTTGAGSIGSTRTVFPPGEPFDGSGFVNLQYPGDWDNDYRVRNGTVAAASFLDPVTNTRYCVDSSSCTAGGHVAAGAPVRDDIGLPFQDTVAVDGVMYTSGAFTSTGNAKYYGSVVVQQGVIDGSGTPGFYFDESLVKGNWPRKGMNLPRVVVSQWETDL